MFFPLIVIVASSSLCLAFLSRSYDGLHRPCPLCLIFVTFPHSSLIHRAHSRCLHRPYSLLLTVRFIYLRELTFSFFWYLQAHYRYRRYREGTFPAGRCYLRGGRNDWHVATTPHSFLEAYGFRSVGSIEKTGLLQRTYTVFYLVTRRCYHCSFIHTQ